MIAVTRREARVTTARILRQCAWPAGHEPAVTAAVLAAGGTGLAALDRDWPDIAGADLGRLHVAGAVFDGGGLHALVIIPFIVDLLAERLDQENRISIRVTGIAAPELLAAVAAFGPRHGAAFFRTAEGFTAEKSIACPPPAQDDFVVDAALWRRLCDRAEGYLVPESEISRRHAGSSLSADGRDAGDAA